MTGSRRSRAQVIKFFGDIDRRPDLRRDAKRLEADTSHEPVVYYMRMDRLVKIGWTTNIRVRVETIGPQGVLAIEYGARQLERARHAQFVAHHSHLEWFWIRDALAAHIADLRDKFAALTGSTVESWLDEHGARSTAIWSEA